MNPQACTENDIRSAINNIIDPCSRAAGAPAGLVDMGLIRALHIEDTDHGLDVRVVVGVTEYGCLLGPAFATEVDTVVGNLAGVASVVVDLDGSFDWLPEDMSSAYQDTLAGRRAAGRAFFLPLQSPNGRPLGEPSNRPSQLIVVPDDAPSAIVS